ncbi:MAG TPA: hypothetical protein VFP72_14605 [Kineosporiaceae bacterium]|nr:hypothetical protein [Kineosporiaceae bacterium]
MPTVAWVLLVVLGFLGLKLVPRARSRTLRAVLVRVAALLFLAAGTVSAGGFVGQLIGSLVHVSGAVGAGVAWVGWLFLAAFWLAGIVPEHWFAGDIPDWLSLSGVLLPSLLASVPGPVGATMTSGMHAVATTVGAGLGAAFGIHA